MPSASELLAVLDQMFQFKPGQVVRHKAQPDLQLVVVEQVLSRDSKGFITSYTLSRLTTKPDLEATIVLLPESALEEA